jgi:hypothetical protein
MEAKKTQAALERAQSRLKRHQENLDAFVDKRVFPWLAGPMVVVVVHIAATAAANFHWLLDAVVTSVFLVFALLLVLAWRSKSLLKTSSSAELLTLWLCTAFLAIEAFASLSTFVMVAQPAAFIGASSPSRSQFVDFYFYHFVDAIPTLKIWDTFALKPPAFKQSSFAAGLLLFVFRVAVLATLAGALKDWISTTRKSPRTHAATSAA